MLTLHGNPLKRMLHLGVAILVGVVIVMTPSMALADGGAGGVQCPTGSEDPGCNLDAGSNGNGPTTTTGNQGTGPSGSQCRNPQGQLIPCQRDGGWAGSDGCYYQPIDPSPATVAALGGQPSGQGGWYLRECYSDANGTTSGFGGPAWVPGAPPVISPAVLARQARARLNLPKVVIGLNPPGPQLTNLPVWLSLAGSSWQPQSATASVPAFTVRATARPLQATWTMGDGSTVACTGPGTAWQPGTDPTAASPDCGYTYRRSSADAPGSVYTVTVTIAWVVTWSGGGQSGTIPGLTTTGDVQVHVQESQAVVTG